MTLSEAEREVLRLARWYSWEDYIAAIERILAARAAAPTTEALAVEALVPESAHEWVKDHYIAFSDFSDPDPSKHVPLGTRPATWRDAPTTWGEVADILAARTADEK